mmetsp:Transcript_22541/g.40674  ORF Transcript_22541/g.40674 Transcript_22541/m.40674 type:complete len:494 (-) Transcript_22541:33-1514(-)
MAKRPNESDAERKVRKVQKKAKKEKKEKKRAIKLGEVTAKPETQATEQHRPRTRSMDAEEKVETEKTSWESFQDTPFAKPIQELFKEAGFTAPSPIQAQSWPVAVGGRDLIAVAKTGSGKTLGFLLPVFHRISTNSLPGGAIAIVKRGSKTPSPLCIVLSPTRELAIQIHGECSKFGAPIGISSECVYGGTNVQDQIKQLRKNTPQVVIATPGRLCDLLERKSLALGGCHFVVLDEADRMLDMGFEPQLKQIMAVLPPDKSLRQTLFFTATWPKAVRRVAATFLRKEETTEVFIDGTADGELVANKSVSQTFIEAQDDEKDKKLYEILCALDEKASVVIFANTKRRVDFVAKLFWQEGFSTCAVHGDKPQHERDASLQNFVNKQCAILVATDVAARGLDIKGVTHVINFDMARDVESYVHRIGRTGRAGEVGEAITFWNPDYDKDCSPALVKIAKAAGQNVPPFLEKYEKGKASKQWKLADAEKAAAVLNSSV